MNIFLINDYISLNQNIPSDFKKGEIFKIKDICSGIIYLDVPSERSFNIENDLPVYPDSIELEIRPLINKIKIIFIKMGIFKLKS